MDMTTLLLSMILKEQGGTGADGKSAYQIAVEHGFEGTEEEWLESLKVYSESVVYVSSEPQTDVYNIEQATKDAIDTVMNTPNVENGVLVSVLQPFHDGEQELLGAGRVICHDSNGDRWSGSITWSVPTLISDINIIGTYDFQYIVSTDKFTLEKKARQFDVDKKVDKTTKINGFTLEEDVELTPSDIGAFTEEKGNRIYDDILDIEVKGRIVTQDDLVKSGLSGYYIKDAYVGERLIFDNLTWEQEYYNGTQDPIQCTLNGTYEVVGLYQETGFPPLITEILLVSSNGTVPSKPYGLITEYLEEKQDIQYTSKELEKCGYSLDLTMNPNNFIMTIELKNKEGLTLSSKQVDLPLESMIVNITYDDGFLYFHLKNQQILMVEIKDIVVGLVNDDFTIAGIDMKDNITKEELQEALAVPTIEDSLNSTDKTNGLSANKGKELNDFNKQHHIVLDVEPKDYTIVDSNSNFSHASNYLILVKEGVKQGDVFRVENTFTKSWSPTTGVTLNAVISAGWYTAINVINNNSIMFAMAGQTQSKSIDGYLVFDEDYLMCMATVNKKLKVALSSLEDYGFTEFFTKDWLKGYYVGSNGVHTTSDDWVCTEEKFSCENGSIVKAILDSPTDLLAFRISYWDEDSYIGYTNVTESNICEFKLPNNANKFSFSINKVGITTSTIGNIRVYINNEIDKLNAKVNKLDTETNAKINEINNDFDRLAFSDGIASKNLTNINNYTNTATDSLTYFNASLTAYNGSTLVKRSTIEIKQNGKYSIHIKPEGIITKVELKHTGASKDVVIFNVNISEISDYVVSFDCNGFNVSNVGGLKLDNIMLEKNNVATDYVPYVARSVSLLNNDFSQLEYGENSGTKNIFKHNFSSVTKNGLTFTVNKDDSISVSGTASANTNLIIGTITTTELMILNGCPSGGASNKYSIRAFVGSSQVARDIGNGVNLPIGTMDIYVEVISGQSVNIVFRPMVSREGGEYQQYIMSNKQLTALNASLATQLFMPSYAKVGYELQGSDGTDIKNEFYFVSDYLNVKNCKTITISGKDNSGTANCFYDENKNLISTVSAKSGTIDVPSNAKYMRLNSVMQNLYTTSVIGNNIGETSTEISKKVNDINNSLSTMTKIDISSNDFIQGVYKGDDGQYLYNETYVCTKEKLPCRGNSKIDLEVSINTFDLAVTFYESDGSYIGFKSTSNRKLSIVSPINASYFHIDVGGVNGGNITPSTMGNISVYVAFSVFNSIKEINSNLGGISKAELSIYDNSFITVGGASYIKFGHIVYVEYDFTVSRPSGVGTELWFYGLPKPLPLEGRDSICWVNIFNITANEVGRMIVGDNGDLRQWYISEFKTGTYTGSFVYIAE